MARLIVISHPEVKVDPNVAIPDWGLNEIGCLRAEAFARSGVLQEVSGIWSSAERKAHETAEILAAHLGVPLQTEPGLGENDRSATGFLPPDQFEAAADAFFANPDASFRGWETATAAQARIVQAVRAIIDAHASGDLAICTHGAVGTLLWCHLSDNLIDRRFDQPGQGHFWRAGLDDLLPESGWMPLD